MHVTIPYTAFPMPRQAAIAPSSTEKEIPTPSKSRHADLRTDLVRIVRLVRTFFQRTSSKPPTSTPHANRLHQPHPAGHLPPTQPLRRPPRWDNPSKGSPLSRRHFKTSPQEIAMLNELGFAYTPVPKLRPQRLSASNRRIGNHFFVMRQNRALSRLLKKSSLSTRPKNRTTVE
jgi:hypothetical protein